MSAKAQLILVAVLCAAFLLVCGLCSAFMAFLAYVAFQVGSSKLAAAFCVALTLCLTAAGLVYAATRDRVQFLRRLDRLGGPGL